MCPREKMTSEHLQFKNSTTAESKAGVLRGERHGQLMC